MAFRKSKKLGPMRFTVTTKGVSTSAGVRGARVSVNSKGEVRRTVGLPGSGIYDTKKIAGGGKKKAPPKPGWTLVESPGEVAAVLMRELPAEQQGAAYHGYRSDPSATLAEMQHSLAEAGWDGGHLAYLMPALRAYMDRWTASS